MLSQHVPAGLAEIRRYWTLRDVMTAIDLIDQIDTIQAKERAKLET